MERKYNELYCIPVSPINKGGIKGGIKHLVSVINLLSKYLYSCIATSDPLYSLSCILTPGSCLLYLTISSISLISSAVNFQSTAFTFIATCSGVLEPTIAAVIPGFRITHAIASSITVRPFDCA